MAASNKVCVCSFSPGAEGQFPSWLEAPQKGFMAALSSESFTFNQIKGISEKASFCILLYLICLQFKVIFIPFWQVVHPFIWDCKQLIKPLIRNAVQLLMSLNSEGLGPSISWPVSLGRGHNEAHVGNARKLQSGYGCCYGKELLLPE